MQLNRSSKLVWFFYIAIGVIALLSSCKNKEPEPAYQPFIGEYTMADHKLSVAQTNVGVQVFIDNQEMPYVSLYGSAMGASNRREPFVDVLILEFKDGKISFAYAYKGNVIKGNLIKNQ